MSLSKKALRMDGYAANVLSDLYDDEKKVATLSLAMSAITSSTDLHEQRGHGRVGDVAAYPAVEEARRPLRGRHARTQTEEARTGEAPLRLHPRHAAPGRTGRTSR